MRRGTRSGIAPGECGTAKSSALPRSQSLWSVPPKIRPVPQSTGQSQSPSPPIARAEGKRVQQISGQRRRQKASVRDFRCGQHRDGRAARPPCRATIHAPRAINATQCENGQKIRILYIYGPPCPERQRVPCNRARVPSRRRPAGSPSFPFKSRCQDRPERLSTARKVRGSAVLTEDCPKRQIEPPAPDARYECDRIDVMPRRLRGQTAVPRTAPARHPQGSVRHHAGQQPP
jgi:hypothetical protein